MAEGSKAHAWRACGGKNPPVGSNPTLSARLIRINSVRTGTTVPVLSLKVRNM